MKQSFFRVFILITFCLISAASPLFSGGSEDASEEIVLNYWASPLGTESQVNRIWSVIVEDFYAETGVKIEFEMVPWADLQTRLLTSMTAGGGPDISGMGNNMSIGFSAAGGLLPLTEERLEKIGGWDRFLEADFIVGEDNKDPVSIPLTIVNGLLYYNTEMFGEAGAESLPNTWDEFIEISQKVTKDTDGDGTIDQWGYGLFGRPIQSWKVFLPLMFQRGVDFLDDDGRIQINSEKGVDALLFLTQLISDYKISPTVAAEWNQDDMVNAFANGEIASMIADSGFMAMLDNSDVAGSYAVGPVPYIWPGRDDIFQNGHPASGHVGGTNIGILKSTRHEEEALQFLEYVSRPDVNALINIEFSSLPPVKSAFSPEDLTPLLREALNVAENHLTPMPRVPYFQPSLNIASQAIQTALSMSSKGPVSRAVLKDLLDKAADEANASFLD